MIGKLNLSGGNGNNGIAPENVESLKIKTGNGKVTIYWSDPSDTIFDEQVVCTWKGTKLIYKAGSYPENIKDGVLVLDNQMRDAYKTEGFEINGLTNNITYYFVLFPYSDKNTINNSIENRISGVPKQYKTMTAIINLVNSNPTTSIAYADDAVDMVAKSDEWDEFFGHYPVLFKDGEEVGKLDPKNFAKFEDGSAADITSGNAGDVMIAFPRRGLKIETSEDGNTCIISMTDNPDDENFKYYAHTKGETRKEIFYKGVYKGVLSSDKMRSLSGKTPLKNLTIENGRTYAQNNGTSYEQSGFYQLVFNQSMYILKYKNLDSQTVLGKGYVRRKCCTKYRGNKYKRNGLWNYF